MENDNQIPMDGSLDEKLFNSFKKSVNDGMVLGLQNAAISLDKFIDRKVELGHPEHITRQELKIFMDTYINSFKESFDKSCKL